MLPQLPSHLWARHIVVFPYIPFKMGPLSSAYDRSSTQGGKWCNIYLLFRWIRLSSACHCSKTQGDTWRTPICCFDGCVPRPLTTARAHRVLSGAYLPVVSMRATNRNPCRRGPGQVTTRVTAGLMPVDLVPLEEVHASPRRKASW